MHEIDGKLQFYVFSDCVESGKKIRDAIEEFARKPGVRFVAQFVGAYSIFGAVEFETLEQAQSAIAADYWEAGVRSEWSTLVESSRVLAPKRGSPDHCAIVRAQAEGDPRELLRAIDDRFEERALAAAHTVFSYGAGVVTGKDFDLLIDLGAETLDELVRTVLVDLRGVDGIRRTATSLAYLPGNEIRPEPSEAS